MALTDNPMSIIATGNVTIGASLEQEIIGDPEVLLYYVSYTSKSRARLGAMMQRLVKLLLLIQILILCKNTR